MGIRELRQEEAKQAYLCSDGRSIINACPRFGKIKVAIDILKQRGINNPMIIAPRKDIEKGWKDDFAKFYPSGVYEFRTFASIKKILPFSHRLVILDEPHELSLQQQADLAKVTKGKDILGLTGTMTDKTREELYDSLDLDTCYKYDINQGVGDGILADYTLTIHIVDLGIGERVKFGKMKYAASKASPLSRHFINLKMINLIQNSRSKAAKTVQLIQKYNTDRLLIFCGVTAVADNLGVPVYHSKAREKEVFLDFCVGGSGGTNHLATIKMMQAGVTIKPINKGIINYMSGNPEDSAQKICRFLGFEYDNPDKKASIHIISSDTDFELQRMKTGLKFFDQSKILYV